MLACTHFTAQQQSINTVFSSEEILKEAKSGHFQWVFHNQTTQEEIANLAKYYTNFFTYTFNNDTKIVDVYPVVDSEDTRRVMLRFLGANQIKEIKVGEVSYELYVFYEKFMKYEAE
ncbi:MAG: hypothetical protein EB023_03515 [Flavobacteriia bacterium]|nr:hypothetical protein [Flavobacteriia bacterium]